MPPLRKQVHVSPDNPNGWAVLDSNGDYLSELEFTSRHPDIAFLELSTASIPSVGKLLGSIARGDLPGSGARESARDERAVEFTTKGREAVCVYYFDFPAFASVLNAQHAMRKTILAHQARIRVFSQEIALGPKSFCLAIETTTRLSEDETNELEKLAEMFDGQFTGDEVKLADP